MPRILRFSYRFIQYITIIATIFLFFTITYYSYQLYDLEKIQKDYVENIIQLSHRKHRPSALLLNINDVHRQLIKIYHHQPSYPISSSSFQKFWKLANNFNLSFHSFEGWKKSNPIVVQIERDFPKSFFGISILVL